MSRSGGDLWRSDRDKVAACKKAAKADGHYKTSSIFPSCVFVFKFNRTIKMSFLKAVQQKQSTIGNNFSLFIGIVTVEGHSSLVPVL